MIKLFFSLLFLLMIFSCNDHSKNKEQVPGSTDSAAKLTVLNKDSVLLSTGNKILSILKNKHYDSLTAYFADSVHFSPYGFIGSGWQTLSAADFTKLLSGNKKISWGAYDGSDDSIDFTVKQYMDKFVYNADFLNAEKTAIDSFIGAGNSLNNLKQAYPGTRFIEYYFSGFEEKYGGMDWTSLRLVFKEREGKYYLVAVVHDQWTI